MFWEILTRITPILRYTAGVILDVYFLWLPVIVFIFFWSFWKRYVVLEALSKEETILFQINLPREINKSPRAMELFLGNLHQLGGEGNFYDKYWKGGTRPWFSLEIVSINGEVKFYIWTRKKFSKIIETQIYSQYPGIEVALTEDYTQKVIYDPEKKTLFGGAFTLTKDDPYPIKTYVDFGLSEDPKEEFKIDPIASMIEFLGSIGLGEQIWVQIIVRAHKKYEKKSFFDLYIKPILKMFETNKFVKKNFEEMAKEIIKKEKEKDLPKEETEIEQKKIQRSKFQDKLIESIERNSLKSGFDTIIRAIYIADKDNFDPINIGGLLGSLKQYSSEGLNGFKPTGTTKIDYPWQDISGKKLAKMKVKIFDAYAKRSGFASRHNVKDFILTTEELATIFHLPSSIVETPTLPRIPSKKSEPPTNLPL